MNESLQEYVSSAGHPLRLDRQASVLRGVKLLGATSRNGRRYQDAALREAISLYEGAKVNVNHPEGDPLAPRDYRDRIGVVRNVEHRPGEGLFGALLFNPKHPLAEQLAWDAEHAPQNVGLSHNVLARTRREGAETVVEAITHVQSVDLVADPAATRGLFEQERPRSGAPGLEGLTLEDLTRLRPDLCEALSDSHRRLVSDVEERLAEVTRQRDEALRAQVASREQTLWGPARRDETPEEFAAAVTRR